MDIDKAWHGLHYLLTGNRLGGRAAPELPRRRRPRSRRGRIWDRDPAEDDTLAYLLVHYEGLTKS
ncbi:hypothetical protein BH18ACT12_BH18ACT12_04940 [soil metagenome]